MQNCKGMLSTQFKAWGKQLDLDYFQTLSYYELDKRRKIGMIASQFNTKPQEVLSKIKK